MDETPVGSTHVTESGLPPLEPSRPWDRGLRPYVTASHAAYVNASDIASDAALLLRHRRHNRSAALAITGLEEAGKALMFWLISLGVVQDSRRAEVLKAVRANHRTKQATALVLRVIAHIIPMARRIVTLTMPKRMPRPKNWAEVETMARQLAEIVAANVGDMIESRVVSEELSNAQAEASHRVAGDLESVRQSALYTDLSGTTALSPNLTRSQAAALVRDLRACLRALKPIVGLVEFDDRGMDGVVASMEMHGRIHRSPEKSNDGS